MSWHPNPESQEYAEGVCRALAEVIDASGLSRQEIDRRVGWTENYLSQVLQNPADVTLQQLFAVLKVLGISPIEFLRNHAKRVEALERPN